ncbi:fimbrial biogenesis outer membrane usher protein [Pluralibacter gergoviae]|uniref:Fimbrial biogenesis outer membrane usher protein n=1 Tax=Pluralibacter gergoviae TaxID=61647 RepID=A0AAI9GM09_PLUGE|nr:fimbrial biogenesis outer membrane usher protein [Pluralibacter gergoviae]EKV9908058.1 fimbrial biogenesis outer membrane usher protein [Pluralibacter gergoviae]EKW7275647.1 fimbrial biogenesis outer membrane usher protein [Pluralibacter gergoviae]ELD4296803.1 fimbrial biogenesis outer membrane usher protein [Pluralibacter gergoviae]ELD4307452.1 fimbrial biogenesis outer membrane usher protein [Pluralibacter gergoviae]
MNYNKSTKISGFRYSPLAWLISSQIAIVFGMSGVAQSREFFNPALLEIDNPAQAGADLSVFEEGSQAPGKYRVDLYVNEEMVDTRDVEFAMMPDVTGKKKLQPCLSRAELEDLGVRVALYPSLKTDSSCINLEQAIPQASSDFLFNQQRLNISVPQAAMNVQARGYVSPDKWDQGIPVLLTNYSFSGANSEGRKRDVESTNSYYLNLRSGINLGAWRLRNYSTWNRDSDGGSHWKSINTYLQRDIIALKSQLVMGDSTTPSEVFDSLPIRGIQLYSDDDMLPDSLRGYSPVVRGIARSNAQVTIRQNGYVIYQSYVPPGPFEIKDLYPTAGSGDLYVVIKESDGSEQNMTVAFAAVPILQREGRLKYSVSSGKYRTSGGGIEETPFSQGTVMYGLPWGATLYGGVQAASKYQSLALGWGQNLGIIGAISADVTQAWSKIKDSGKKDNGQSWRMRYGKNFVETGTNFSLASYRYSTEGFYSMQEALDSYNNAGNMYYYNHKKSRAEVSISQNLGDGFGSFTLSGIREEYWNSSRKTESASIGYNNSWEGISYGLNYTYSKNGYDSFGQRVSNNDQIFSFNVSVPLSKWLPDSNYAYARYNLYTSKKGNTTHNAGVYGTLLEDHNLNYNINQSYGTKGSGYSGNASVNYRGGQGDVNLGYSYNDSSRQVNYGIEGGVLVHENGITLSQAVNETAVLVKAPGASGARISNNTGVTTDWRGYAVVPYVTPYRKTEISMNTETLGDDVDMTMTTQSVIPTRGAIVRADFKPNVGIRALLTLMRAGQPIPFGAMVTDVGNPANNGSIVGDGGQVYMSGMSATGTLLVKWGSSAAQQCQATYSLPESKESGIQMATVECR